MVLGQQWNNLFETHQTGCRQDAHLTHTTSQSLAQAVRSNRVDISIFGLHKCFILLFTHCVIKLLDPTSTDPTGADKLLLRQMDTESKSRAMRSTLTPKAAAALNTLAPSMCKAMRTVPTPDSRSKADRSSRKESGITLPPQMFWVFSTTTSLVTGSWQSSYCRIFCRNSARLKVPSGWFLIVTNWTPAKCAAPAKRDKDTDTQHQLKSCTWLFITGRGFTLLIKKDMR